MNKERCILAIENSYIAIWDDKAKGGVTNAKKEDILKKYPIESNFDS